MELTVVNTGPVVPPYEIEAIFEPFWRLRGGRVGSERGAGLGLSIVRAIAAAHGGLVVTVLLPAASVPAAPPKDPGEAKQAHRV